MCPRCHPERGEGFAFALPIQTPTRPLQRSSARTTTHRISGTGLKNGKPTLRESPAASPDGQTFTLTYTVYRGDRINANGIAIFEKAKTN